MSPSPAESTSPRAQPPFAVLLMGPTASGKSALARALAQRFAIEIGTAASAQVYRGMDIGTAKPDAEARRAVPHHLLDIRDPTESYSAAQFRADALALIDAITARGRTPLLVGGTMLYFKALREGLSNLPRADAAVRAAIEAEARARGWGALHAELARFDPETAARLQPTDAQRIQRAIEIFRLTGTPMSGLLGEREAAPSVRLVSLALAPRDRAALHARIAERFDRMLEAGLVEELADLRRRHALHLGLPSMRCVGYRQAWRYLEGECDRAALRERGIFATRQLAKRQLTWLRATPRLATLDCFAAGLVERSAEIIARALDRPPREEV